jgi:hypothetical protein
MFANTQRRIVDLADWYARRGGPDILIGISLGVARLTGRAEAVDTAWLEKLGTRMAECTFGNAKCANGLFAKAKKYAYKRGIDAKTFEGIIIARYVGYASRLNQGSHRHPNPQAKLYKHLCRFVDEVRAANRWRANRLELSRPPRYRLQGVRGGMLHHVMG